MLSVVLRYSILVVCVSVFILPNQTSAFSLKTPEQLAAAINLGSSYDPQPRIGIAQLSLMALYDYEQIMPHAAPDPLRLKFEATLGVADDSRFRAIGAVNFLAFYYLTDLARGSFRPYAEAGAGVVFTDFQVEGQGLRINFNPLAGIGAEWQSSSGQRWFTAVRVHHVSNSELHEDNRGINSLLYQLGVCF